MMILLEFNIFKKSQPDAPSSLFWSCALEADITKADVDFDYLNRNNYDIEGDAEFKLHITYKEFTPQIISQDYKDYIKRPRYFIASDKTWLTGSPYSHSSSYIETYYQDAIEFIAKLKNKLEIDSDYKTNQLQLRIIETIKKYIGIDILKNESIIGALSIYTRLAAFHVGGNFNIDRGERYITTYLLDSDKNISDAFINIDIIDDNKVLYNVHCKFFNNQKYKLPSLDNLEQFSQIRISIFDIKKGETDVQSENDAIYHKIYEETFHLIRSFNIGMSVGGGHSKIVRNRFVHKLTDKIGVSDHISNISNKSNKDFFDLEYDYKMQLLGTKKEFLDSKYFRNDDKGKGLFLSFIRSVLATAKDVTVIDAYFDNFALDDILACSNTRFNLIIITTDPKKNKRKNAKNLVANIHNIFPECKVYFTDKIHDRYLYIKNQDGEKLYSLSNSWNGLVNHYSLYIQEVPLEISLQIYEEISCHTSEENIQQGKLKTEKKRRRAVKNQRKYTLKYADELSETILTMPPTVDVNIFIKTAVEYFTVHYFRNINKGNICTEIIQCIRYFEEPKIDYIIENLIIMMLKDQRHQFEEKSTFIDGKSFSWYDTPQKCYRRLANGPSWGQRSHQLSLDYGMSELLGLFFQIYPIKVIEILQEQEKKICVMALLVKKYKAPYVYHVSENIISSFLCDLYPAKGILSEKAQIFISKCNQYNYIRFFFALILIDKLIFDCEKNQLTFSGLIDSFQLINLNDKEKAIILGSAFNRISLQQRVTDFQNDIKEKIENFILQNCNGINISIYAYYAFINSYDVSFGKLYRFCFNLREINKNNEAEVLEKLLLLDSLRINQSLQLRIAKIIQADISLLNETFQSGDDLVEEKEFAETDIRKYIPALPYLGGVLAEYINKCKTDEFDAITNSLNIDKNIIFNIKYPSQLSLFYFDLLFLLYSIVDIPNNNPGKIKILSLTKWYLPVCIKNVPNDFHGLALKIVSIYTIFIDDIEKKQLNKQVNYLPMNGLILSTINNQKSDFIVTYNKVIVNTDIDDYNKSIVVENLLTIGIALCIRCSENCNKDLANEIINVISSIYNKIEPILTESVKPILPSGLLFARSPNKQSKNEFIKTMENKYFPPQVCCLLEEK
ncbi:hypothetical protein AGMMS50268_30160 [Spirochaetia bacterium]|nr:hypothetical protein AGMMS50268_30160 [Spirochaetia bacterium]